MSFNKRQIGRKVKQFFKQGDSAWFWNKRHKKYPVVILSVSTAPGIILYRCKIDKDFFKDVKCDIDFSNDIWAPQSGLKRRYEAADPAFIKQYRPVYAG